MKREVPSHYFNKPQKRNIVETFIDNCIDLNLLLALSPSLFIHRKDVYIAGVAPERRLGGCSPLSGKSFVSIGEFLTENCVIMHRKMSFILLFSPLSGKPALSLGKSSRHPCL